MSEDFTISMEVRLPKLPPPGHLQSLLRFSLPDIAQSKKLHRTSVYVRCDGRLLGKPILKDEPPLDNSTSTAMRPDTWHIVSIVVKPMAGQMTTYVNGKICMTFEDLNAADLALQHKIVVLGGGKQAHAKGGDLRRMVICDRALSAAEVKGVFNQIAHESPTFGDRLRRVQALIRGRQCRVLLKRKESIAATEVEIPQPNIEFGCIAVKITSLADYAASIKSRFP